MLNDWMCLEEYENNVSRNNIFNSELWFEGENQFFSIMGFVKISFKNDKDHKNPLENKH